MGPVVIDGLVQENQLTDEEYVIHRAKYSQKLDDATAKAWMITAKTLFPRNFAVQLEAYTSQKIVKNPKEAARHFSTLFFDFRNEAGLWDEIHCITEALQAGASTNSQFYRDLFSHLLPDVQHDLLLAVAERTQDMLEHCRLMLLLISKLPQAIDTQGKKLIDTLLTAEKHCHHLNPVNCFRKLLVFDLLPTLLSSRTVDVPLKQLHRLILKSIEFYVCWLTGGSSIIQGLEESDLEPSDAWKNLFKMMFAMGRKLSWELSSIFCPEGGNREVMCQNLWIFYRSTPLGNEENPNFKQLVYCTTVLLFESLYEYFMRLDPSCFQPTNQGGKGDGTLLVLVRSFFPAADSATESLKYRNKDEIIGTASRPVTVTSSCSPSTASALLSSFFTAVSCWELLHQTDDLKNAFSKICVELQTDTWNWLPSFITDGVFIYQGLFADALDNLKKQNDKSISPTPLLLKSAGIYLSLGNQMGAVENVLHVMANLPDGGNHPPSTYPLVPHTGNSHWKVLALLLIMFHEKIPIHFLYFKHPLHFMAMNRAEIIQYCVSILIACFKDRAFRSGNISDIAIGHLIVLLQFDWPNNAGLLEEIIDRIRRQGHFSYALFVSYVVHVDILEEFAFLATDQGGPINMDIFPSALHSTSQRRMTTRRGDLGAREDFRMAMKRQMGRSIENIQILIPRFIIQEKETIIQALNN